MYVYVLYYCDYFGFISFVEDSFRSFPLLNQGIYA